ncbi:nucleoside 2-deoxyribosyltransferase [Fundidesulfovibrio soli]|uniref:nucleoside 2-deoxyribosyltransferase n=1 Tax=Fundidesulfovibrio soli TaxID=2922716 RepID=UPI001FAF5A5E|nr:nucleoside 2-deoxyribosyltransferase [Fundidesulfovibrio soli]
MSVAIPPELDRIYLAGPLFCEGTRAWHRATKARIEAETGRGVVWPYELFDPEDIPGWGQDAPRKVMEACRDALAVCSLVVALLDGPQVDDGTAWEIGFAHARCIPVIGVRTDFRLAGDVPGSLVNAMIQASCERIVTSTDELLRVLRERAAGRRGR